MAVEITCNYSGLAAQAINTRIAKNSRSAKDGNVTTSTVELKTSTPGKTRTE